MKEMTAALIIQDKKLLLVHNTKHNSLRIEPPGGKKEIHETLEECVVREVNEELGVLIELVKLFGVYETKSPEGDFKVSMYFSNIKKGRIKLMEPEKISKYGWYSLNEINNFKEKGVLVPNLSNSLNELSKHL